MEFVPNTCPACNKSATVMTREDWRRIDCPRCGTYEVTGTTESLIRSAVEGLRHSLSIATRRAWSRGQVLQLPSSKWQGLAESSANISLDDKRRSILEHIRLRSDGTFGAEVPIYWESDYPLFGCKKDELPHLCSLLTRTELLDRRQDGNAFALSDKGWTATDPPSGGAEPGTCFVAMAFASSLDDAYQNAIEPAVVHDCKMRVVRVDRVHHNGIINDRILVELRRAEAVVADFTIPREGVYFEAGIGLGLDRTVVFTSRRLEFDNGRNVHFDTRPMNHVLWDHPEDFRESLAARLMNTVPSLLRRTRR